MDMKGEWYPDSCLRFYSSNVIFSIVLALRLVLSNKLGASALWPITRDKTFFFKFGFCFVLFFKLSSAISHPIFLALFHFRGKRVPPCENVAIKNRLAFKIFKDFHQKRSHKQNLYFYNSVNLCLWPSFYGSFSFTESSGVACIKKLSFVCGMPGFSS